MTLLYKGKRILVLGDSSSVGSSAGHHLSGLGAELLPATDSKHAEEMLSRHGADALVTDLQRSRIDWLTSLRGRFPDLAIIVTTGFTDGGLVTDTALGTVATTVIAQPYAPQDIASAVRHALLRATLSSASDALSMNCTPAPSRVLVAEDDHSSRVLLEAHLKKQGYEPICVEDGVAAIEAVATQDFDILITDIMMPRMDGIELTRKVQQFRPTLPIIVVSTAEDAQVSVEALKAGAYCYVPKPLNIQELSLFMDRAMLVERLQSELCDQNAVLVKRSEELEKALKAMHEQADLYAAGRQSWLTQLSAKVAHELKNPVNSIGASFYYVRSQMPPESLATKPKIGRHCEIIETQIQRSQEIIEGMLDLARPGTACLDQIQVNALLRESTPLALPAEHEIDVRLELDPALPLIRGSESKLKQVFSNLVGNSAKAMKNAGVLTVTTATDGVGNVTITFTDSGPGLPSSIIHKVFDAFFTTDDKAGTGLGLCICREMVKQLGGTIRASNATAGGAVFSITLPSHCRPRAVRGDPEAAELQASGAGAGS